MMNPQEIRSAAEAICELRNPTRQKRSEDDIHYGQSIFARRSEIAAKEAAIADEKELKEVWQ